MKPRLLDLFCGAGGAAQGYANAGFDVVGVDINPQPNYPFEFHQGDATKALSGLLHGMGTPVRRLDQFAAIHASPPCQAYSTITRDHSAHPDLVAPVRELLQATGLPYVIENVVGAPLQTGFILCGSMFGMEIRRHRLFESNILIMPPVCDHSGERPYTITGSGGACDTDHSRKPAPRDFWRYMDMPWMEGKDPKGCAQAIPPAYTTFIGTQLLAALSPQEGTDND